MFKHFLAVAVLILAVCTPMYGQPDMRLVIDDNTGNVAIFNVAGGVVIPDFTGCAACSLGNLYTPGASDPNQGQLVVTGTIGQFTTTITGQGGGFTVAPTHQNLNEIDATSMGAGTLNVEFTATDYTTFGNPFFLSASGTYSAPVNTSTSDFVALMDPANTVPATVPIGALLGLGCAATTPGSPCSFSTTAPFANPTGSPSGSLTTSKEIRFTGAGEIQLNLSIASAVVPEPGSVVLFGTLLLGTGLGLRRKFGKV